MAFSQCFSLFLPVLVIFLLTSSSPALSEAQSTQDLIDRVCRQMEEYGFCNNAFHENMKTPETDYVGLTAIAIDLAIKNASNTYDYIVLLAENTTNPSTKGAYMACECAYGIVKSSFMTGLGYFNRKDYAGMLEAEHDIPRTQANCEARLSTPPTPNPLADRNRQMRMLITMALVTGHEIPQY
ncbi:hypothetical protein SADUNF_Sadunf13G0004900 [Salix dunnii]|uniref:Pectinesterase inhibitor domain-containing protein n=1 Tax=Salix dunnii TaxID=1413687 RepID=A0A835JIA8_9ROSI|nr:hypothetical protein SADUNF_Sadunf13G0004900 [Salix dunnii]